MKDLQTARRTGDEQKFREAKGEVEKVEEKVKEAKEEVKEAGEKVEKGEEELHIFSHDSHSLVQKVLFLQ